MNNNIFSPRLPSLVDGLALHCAGLQWILCGILGSWNTPWWHWVHLGLAMVPQKVKKGLIAIQAKKGSIARVIELRYNLLFHICLLVYVIFDIGQDDLYIEYLIFHFRSHYLSVVNMYYIYICILVNINKRAHLTPGPQLIPGPHLLK